MDECYKNAVIIFDDIISENQNIVRDYFTRERHKNIDCFYQAQTYSKVPKQLIRDNANFLCVFRQDDTNLKHIHSDFVGGDIPFEKFFRDICSKC